MLKAWLAGDIPRDVFADWCEEHGVLFPRVVRPLWRRSRTGGGSLSGSSQSSYRNGFPAPDGGEARLEGRRSISRTGHQPYDLGAMCSESGDSPHSYSSGDEGCWSRSRSTMYGRRRRLDRSPDECSEPAVVVRIEDFIRTGRFGPVTIGMTKAEVVALIGQPEADSSLGANGSIFTYAWYELFFDPDDVLHAIQNDNYSPDYPDSYEFNDETLLIDSWFLDSDPSHTIDTVAEMLDAAGIEFERVEYWRRGVLRAESGVIVDFDDADEVTGHRRLIGVRYFPH